MNFLRHPSLPPSPLLSLTCRHCKQAGQQGRFVILKVLDACVLVLCDHYVPDRITPVSYKECRIGLCTVKWWLLWQKPEFNISFAQFQSKNFHHQKSGFHTKSLIVQCFSYLQVWYLSWNWLAYKYKIMKTSCVLRLLVWSLWVRRIN